MKLDFKSRSNTFILKALALCLCLVLVLGLAACRQEDPVEELPEEPSGSSEEENKILPTIGEEYYPTDKLFYEKERQGYVNGEMTLVVPRLNLEVPVVNGTTDADLRNGVGLFDYAQLPGVRNENVSIAGHRDIYGCEFYEIDKMGEGDLMYLIYNGKEYVYEYELTEIIASNDWSFVYCTTYSRISLMSCDPIGTSLNRIIVQGRLVAVNDVEG